jgi:hypothetical protein
MCLTLSELKLGRVLPLKKKIHPQGCMESVGRRNGTHLTIIKKV